MNLDFGEGLRPDPGSLEVLSHAASEVRVIARASGWGASEVRYQLDSTYEVGDPESLSSAFGQLR